MKRGGRHTCEPLQKLFVVCIFVFVIIVPFIVWMCTFYLDFTGSNNTGNLTDASPGGNSRNVLQEPWVMSNVWYQLANYSVRSPMILAWFA